MKRKIIALLVCILTMVSCDVAKELAGAYNMVNCNYNYKSITGLTISGINVSNGLSLTTIPKITSILSGSASSIPMNFTLNLDVNNPNQTEAMLKGMQYIISVDDIEFTTGSMSQALNIGAGKTQTLPLSIGVDLASLMKSNSKDAVVGITKNFLGIGNKKSTVKLQVKPSFNVGGSTITSPMYIPVTFSFGG